jgi:hypothetical protein
MIINLTPHAITDVVTNKTFPPSGTVARVATTQTQVGDLDGIPLFSTTYGDIQDLPPQQDDTYYLVSLLVKQALPYRKDLLSPSTLVRDDKGNPIGCKGFNK